MTIYKCTNCDKLHFKHESNIKTIRTLLSSDSAYGDCYETEDILLCPYCNDESDIVDIATLRIDEIKEFATANDLQYNITATVSDEEKNLTMEDVDRLIICGYFIDIQEFDVDGDVVYLTLDIFNEEDI